MSYFDIIGGAKHAGRAARKKVTGEVSDIANYVAEAEHRRNVEMHRQLTKVEREGHGDTLRGPLGDLVGRKRKPKPKNPYGGGRH